MLGNSVQRPLAVAELIASLGVLGCYWEREQHVFMVFLLPRRVHREFCLLAGKHDSGTIDLN